MSADPALYRVLFELGGDPILVVEGERVVDANRRAQAVLGEARDALVGRKLAHLFAPVQPGGRTSAEAVEELIGAAWSDSPLRTRWLFRRDPAPLSALVEVQGLAFGDRRLVVLSWHPGDGQSLRDGSASESGIGSGETGLSPAAWPRRQEKHDALSGDAPGARGQNALALDAEAGDVSSPFLAVPVEAGGATIGVLGVSGDPPVPLAEDERQLLESISRQAGEALQRARLLEEARERARRERLIRDISDRMQRATDLESLIAVAAQGLAEALGASRVYVRMGMFEGLGEE